MRRWHLSKRDRKQLLSQLREAYGLNVGDRVRVEKVVEDDIELILIDGLPAFIKIEDRYIPHLLYVLRRGDTISLAKIVVDQGAVKPIARGADLMRPGIVRIDGDFDKDQIVVIVEPTRGLPLAIHKTLYSREEIEAMEKGRVTKRLHHLGDRYWRLGEEVMLPT